mmetsp:Transcript_25910/g.86849  ORF Transcript_25910/g.86849 Transcript_25910/m.86849 type:complete len:321 (+) Transcript_25910:596-1558(+)
MESDGPDAARVEAKLVPVEVLADLCGRKGHPHGDGRRPRPALARHIVDEPRELGHSDVVALEHVPRPTLAELLGGHGPVHDVAHVYKVEAGVRQARDPAVVELQQVATEQGWEPVSGAPDADRGDADAVETTLRGVNHALLRQRLGEVVRRQGRVGSVKGHERPRLHDGLMLRVGGERVDGAHVHELLHSFGQAGVDDILRASHVDSLQDGQVPRSQGHEGGEVKDNVHALHRRLHLVAVHDVRVHKVHHVLEVVQAAEIALVDHRPDRTSLGHEGSHEEAPHEASGAGDEHLGVRLAAAVLRLEGPELLLVVARQVRMH